MSTVTWTGQSGKKYPFELYSIGTTFNAVAAVYIFTKKKTDGRWASIYIGETSNLSERFDNHHAMPCIKRNGATHICVYTEGMGNSQQRKAVERDLLASPIYSARRDDVMADMA